MIRNLAALGAACLLACLPAAAAMAASTGPFTLGNGLLSPSIPVTANSTVTVSFPGAAPIDASTTGRDIGVACYTVMRSQDGVNFAPLARDAAGNLAHYCGPISNDFVEYRSGTSYAIQADPGAPAFTARIDQ